MNVTYQLKHQGSRLLSRRQAIYPCTLGLRLTSTCSQSSPHPKHVKEQDDGWFWPHPVYSIEDMESIKIAHRNARTLSDKVALSAVTSMRWCFDKATGYKHSSAIASGDMNKTSNSSIALTANMTPEMWLRRIIFLESIAGVPGMVAAILRHLRSIRRLRKDSGWIEVLLEEAMNERMHLLTFLSIRKPGPFMRAMILLGQGVMTNFLFFTYLLHPKTVHRFVGFLEEEAVITYSRCIADLDEGRLEEWRTLSVPPIAEAYWKLPKNATMRELLLAVRQDESKHREVNHTFANLNSDDPAPFTTRLEGNEGRVIVKPTGHKASGWERQELFKDGSSHVANSKEFSAVRKV